MASFENMQWTLIAQDEASGTLKKIALAAKEVGSASESMAKSTEAASSSWQDTAKGVIAGGIALQGAQMAFEAMRNVIRDGIGEAEEYERIQSQLAATLTATGGAAGLTIADLNGMADSMANMAVGGSETINAMQNNLLTFTNIGKDMFGTVSQAALDMTTSLKGGVLPSVQELQSASIMLGKAFQDPISGMSALSKVGAINKDEARRLNEEWSSGTVPLLEQQADLADALAKEYGGSAAAATKTFSGRMVALNNSLGDAKKIIGQALLPTLSMLIGDVADSTGKIKVNDDTMSKWQLRIYQASTILIGGIKVIANFGKTIYLMGVVAVEWQKTWWKVIGGAIEALLDFKSTAKTIFESVAKAMSGDFSGALDTMSGLIKKNFNGAIASFDGLAGAAGDLVNQMTHNFDPMDEAIKKAMNHEEFDKMTQEINETAGAGAGLGDGLGGLADASEDAAKSQEKLAESVSKVGEDYTKAREDIAKELADLEESHAQNIGKIKENLVSLQETLEETTADYQKSMADLNKTEAEKVIEQEQKIADIKASIAEAIASATEDTTGGTDNADEVKRLQAQLAQEEAAYSAYIETRTGLDAELAEARRRASETQFQRDIEDINAKRAEEQSAYDARIAEIQGEVLAEQAALAEEQAVYEAKKAMYAEVDAAFQAFHDSYMGNMEGMRTYTSESVAVMSAELARITALFSQIQSLRSSAGLVGVDLGAASGATTGGATTTETSSVSNQVTNYFTIEVKDATTTAESIIAEVQRQIELAGLGST